MVDQAKIHRKVVSSSFEKRRNAANSLCNNFADLPDKEEAWKDLIRLTGDTDRRVRRHASGALMCAFPRIFPHIPDRKQGWKDLTRLMQSKNVNVRRRVENKLGAFFSGILDMGQAWKDLIELMQDKDVNVRQGAVHILGTAFPHVPDKNRRGKI